MATTATPTRKPCDQCTRRKIKCTYETPCARCVESNLHCTYAIVRKKRGPKKGRGAVLDRLRSPASQPSSHAAPTSEPEPFQSAVGDVFLGENAMQHSPSLSAAHHFSPHEASRSEPQASHHNTDAVIPNASFHLGLAAAGADESLTFDEFAQHVLADSNYFIDGATHSPPIPDASTLNAASVNALLGATPQTPLTSNIVFAHGVGDFEITPIVERAIELFFVHIYPTYPLISRATASAWLQNPDLLSKQEQTLIYSICASTLAIVDSWPDIGYEQRAISARGFIRKCHQLRLDWSYMEEPCFEDIVTSLFIANTLFDLKQRKASWMHVREAINLAVGAGLHNETSYLDLDEDTKVRRRRTYALLYITERGASIQDGFPVSILLPPPLIETTLEGEDAATAHGLSSLHGLFSLLDFKFVKLWNEPANNAFASSSFSDLALLQSHLRELRIDQTGLSDVQRADVLVTQQWLRLIFWQAALRQGYISTAAEDSAFTYNYPIDVAMDMCQVVKSLPPVAIQAHGLGIFEKQFEVAYSLMDALALSGASLPEHHECLRYLLLSLSASPNSQQLYVRTLQSKIGSHQKYRRLAGVELLRDDRGSRQNSRRGSRAFVSTRHTT